MNSMIRKQLPILCAVILAIVFCFQNMQLFALSLITEYGVHGVVLIESDDKVIFKKSTLKTDDPQFLCASLIKQITSVLILRECERGKIQLHEKANNYLKESQNIDNRIEIQHLLSHTSGLQENNSLKFAPGSAYEYSNYGYVVLGRILENVTHSSFSELAQKLFAEQGMNDSFLVDAPTLSEIQRKHPNVVLSATADKVQFSYIEKNSKYVFPRNSCGGLISTAADLSKWNRQLHGGKILSDASYQAMIYPRIEANFPEGYYGYGLCRYSQDEIYSIGYACGYKATLSYFPQSRVSLVILENDSCGDYQKDFRWHRWIRWLVRLISSRIL